MTLTFNKKCYSGNYMSAAFAMIYCYILYVYFILTRWSIQSYIKYISLCGIDTYDEVSFIQREEKI